MATHAALLGDVPLFRPLEPAEREVLASQLDEIDVLSGERVFSVGDPGGAIFVVSQGSVQISLESSTGETFLYDTVRPGGFFGELSLLDGRPRSSNAVAIENTKVLRIDRGDLEALFRLHPDAALDLMTVMGGRLRETEQLLRVRPSPSPNDEVAERATRVQRIADSLAYFSGTVWFVGVHIVWFAIWIAINMGALSAARPFDPFPFGLLTMIVSLEAIFLSCFVLISQNRQAAKDKIRSDVEYAANIRAGREVTQLHVKIDRLQEQLLLRLNALEKPRRV